MVETESESDDSEQKNSNELFIPGISQLDKDHVLVPDYSAYKVLLNFSVTWPCLSFDVIHDNLDNDRRSFPTSCMLVTATQAAIPDQNSIMILLISNIALIDQNLESDDEEQIAQAKLDTRSITTNSCTNRIRYNPHRKLIAVSQESSRVLIFDISNHIDSLIKKSHTVPSISNTAIHTIHNHKVEGYALAWSKVDGDCLLTGDSNGNIFENVYCNGWSTKETWRNAHNGSVEDIEFVEQSTFISCGSDGFIRVWKRSTETPILSVNAHVGVDINVISWHPRFPYLLVSGADNGIWSVWDLRQWKENSTGVEPVATFDWHKKAITSIEWHPLDDSVIAIASEDDQVTLWDLSVELDAEESQGKEENLKNLPSQLLFIHMGQSRIKELHWHPQIPGLIISTASEGFNLFQTISV